MAQISGGDAGIVLNDEYARLLQNAGYGEDTWERIRKGFQMHTIQDGLDSALPPGMSIISSPTNISGPVTGDTNFSVGGNTMFDFSTINNGTGGGAPGPAGSDGPAGADGADGADGAPGAGAFWQNGAGTTHAGAGTSGDAYYIDLDVTLSATTDMTENTGSYPGGVTSLKLLALDADENSGDIFRIEGTNLKFVFHTVKIEIDKSAEGIVTGLKMTQLGKNEFTVPLEEQLCPDPCTP